MKSLHPETPAARHFLKAFSSARPGLSEAVNSVGFFSLPRAIAIQPFPAHTITLHGALLPPRSQVLMASLSLQQPENPYRVHHLTYLFLYLWPAPNILKEH